MNKEGHEAGKTEARFRDIKSLTEHLDGYWDTLASIFNGTNAISQASIASQMNVIGEILQDLKPLVERENKLKKFIRSHSSEMIEELKEILELD